MPRAEVPDGDEDASEDTDLFTGAFTVRIAVLSPRRVVAATVTPLNLGTGEPELTAVVSWEGVDVVSSSVQARVQPGPNQADPWLRFLQLLWVVLGPKTVPARDALGPGHWSSAVLSTQELDGALQHAVVLEVDRTRGTARLIRSDQSRQDAELAVPTALLDSDAGSVLAEMTSRLIRGQAWL